MNKLKALFDSYIDKENFNYSLYNEIENDLKRLDEKEHNLKVEMKVNAGLIKRLARITKEKEKQDEILRIIKKHKLLNYVLKNPKCAGMYHLSEIEIALLREAMK